MIIDCHTHLSFRSGEVVSARDLIDSMKGAKIDKVLVYGGEMFNCPNEKLLEEIAPFRKNLFPVGSISPFSKNKPTLRETEKWLSENKIYGLKFYTGYEYFYPNDDILKPYLALLEKYKKPAVFHSGDTWNQVKGAKLKYAHPLNFDDLAIDMPELKIVIAHFGYPWVMDTAEVIYKNKNVFTDCSGLFYGEPSEQDKIAVKKTFADYLYYGGSLDKVFFGTDWGLADQQFYVKLISEALPSAEDKEKVFYKNAIEVFKI